MAAFFSVLFAKRRHNRHGQIIASSGKGEALTVIPTSSANNPLHRWSVATATLDIGQSAADLESAGRQMVSCLTQTSAPTRSDNNGQHIWGVGMIA